MSQGNSFTATTLSSQMQTQLDRCNLGMTSLISSFMLAQAKLKSVPLERAQEEINTEQKSKADP